MIGLEHIMEEIKKDVDYDQLKINLEKIAPTQLNFDNLLELLDFVYYLGIDDGDSEGYNNALKENKFEDEDYRIDEARDIAWDEGNREGRDEGYEDGRAEANEMSEQSYNEGEIQGYGEGKEEGRAEGRAEGIEEGEQAGYQLGFEDGLEEGKNYVS